MEYSLDYEYRRFKFLETSFYWFLFRKKLKVKYKSLLNSEDNKYRSYVLASGIIEIDKLSEKYQLHKQWLYSLFLFGNIEYKDLKNPLINYISYSDGESPIKKGFHILVTPYATEKEISKIYSYLKKNIFPCNPIITNQYIEKVNYRADKRTQRVFSDVITIEKLNKRLLTQPGNQYNPATVIEDSCYSIACKKLNFNEDRLDTDNMKVMNQITTYKEKLIKEYRNYCETHNLPKISDCNNLAAIFS